MVERMFCTHKVIGSTPVISIFSEMKKKDVKKRYSVAAYSLLRAITKFVQYKSSTPSYYRYLLMLFLQNFPRNASATRTHNFCVVTTRSRGVVSRYRLSRNMFKIYALSGLLPGFRKASW